MIIIGEEGSAFEGERTEVAKDAPMEEGVVYEFRYVVHSLTDRWPFDKIRAFAASKFVELVAKFRGLEIIYWRLTDEELLFQARGLSTSTWQEIALATVAVACQGLFLVMGVILVLKAIFQILPIAPPVPEPKRYWWAWLLGGLSLLTIIFIVGYFRGKATEKKEEKIA